MLPPPPPPQLKSKFVDVKVDAHVVETNGSVSEATVVSSVEPAVKVSSVEKKAVSERPAIPVRPPVRGSKLVPPPIKPKQPTNPVKVQTTPVVEAERVEAPVQKLMPPVIDPLYDVVPVESKTETHSVNVSSSENVDNVVNKQTRNDAEAPVEAPVESPGNPTDVPTLLSYYKQSLITLEELSRMFNSVVRWDYRSLSDPLDWEGTNTWAKVYVAVQNGTLSHSDYMYLAQSYETHISMKERLTQEA